MKYSMDIKGVSYCWGLGVQKYRNYLQRILRDYWKSWKLQKKFLGITRKPQELKGSFRYYEEYLEVMGVAYRS